MKKVYFSFLVLMSVILNAQVVFESSLSEAFKKAKEQNKQVFIEYYNSDCSVCKRLGDLLRTDQEVSTFYNKRFINYAMNSNESLSEEDNNFITKANLHFESVPILLYFDKNQNFLHHSGVTVTSEHVINEAKKAILPDYNTSGLKAKYDAGDRSVRTLYAYCDMLKVNKNDIMLTKVAQDLFESFKKEELPTNKSYVILKQVVNSSDNGFFQYWINNVDKLKDFETGQKAGTEILSLEKIVLKELSDPNVKKWDLTKKNKFKQYILKLKITDNPEVFFE
ncbi:thioredoxin family protein [Flavobacterium ardleyense]|uniref:Thioredoxin family protein n=1 Tax=Flavobacterium ardleyense TaxID=2038737 RepID=A0ABW5Z6X4_9FLAO